MADGKIAELPTGEGKTLAAVFTASLFALRRPARPRPDLQRLPGPPRRGLDGAGLPASRPFRRRRPGGHGQAGEEGGLCLRCHLRHGQGGRLRLPARPPGLRARRARPPPLRRRPRRRGRLHPHRRGPHPARHLRDRRRRPASTSPGWPPSSRGLERGRDYETDAENANVFPTDAGIRRIESLLGCGNLFAPENETLLAAVHCALHAQVLLERDVDYIVRDGRIEIVDEFTGRVMDKRHWPDGLQAAVEAKEGVRRGAEGRILGSITLQHFFRLYPTLCGMTATAAPSAARAQGILRPRRRRRPAPPAVRPAGPSRRRLHPQGRQARRPSSGRSPRVHAAGRPVLVGTASVRESEELAAALAAGRRRRARSSTPRTTSSKRRSSPGPARPAR